MRSLSLFYVEFIQRKKDARKTLLKGSASTHAIEKDAIEVMRIISLFSLRFSGARDKKKSLFVRARFVCFSTRCCALVFLFDVLCRRQKF